MRATKRLVNIPRFPRCIARSNHYFFFFFRKFCLKNHFSFHCSSKKVKLNLDKLLPTRAAFEKAVVSLSCESNEVNCVYIGQPSTIEFLSWTTLPRQEISINHCLCLSILYLLLYAQKKNQRFCAGETDTKAKLNIDL